MNVRSLFAGWSFRTATPSFEVGDEFEAYSTARGELRIGDSVLTLDRDVPADRRVHVRVTTFDDATHRGRAEVLEVEDVEP